MIVHCHPVARTLPEFTEDVLPVLLYGQTDRTQCASAGAAIADRIRRKGIVLPARAWDLLSIALAVTATDILVTRGTSSDGWTRQLDLVVGVQDPDFWNGQATLLASMLRFLTTDIWTFRFVSGRYRAQTPRKRRVFHADAVSLLSGGMDSLIGALDLAHDGTNPLVVSQTVRGDGEKQIAFARDIGGGLTHLQLNHNADGPWESERSQRARSFIFLTYGVIGACSLRAFRAGQVIPLYVCENGLIALNPPMTEMRTGSRSTRTAHPRYLWDFQRLLESAGLSIRVENPYAFKTKGEMLAECSNQAFLQTHAHRSTSCGRFGRYGMKHCGRCLPCIIRRAAFGAWGRPDQTEYVFDNLGARDGDHAGFDDVRAAAIGVARLEAEGVGALLGTTLLCDAVKDPAPYREVTERGIREVGQFLSGMGVK